MAFLANLALSFGFSFFTYLLIEAPFANMLNDFFRLKPSRLLGKPEHYQSQSAKAHLRDKSTKKDRDRDLHAETSGGQGNAKSPKTTKIIGYNI